MRRRMHDRRSGGGSLVRELTADLLVGRLVDWGVDTVFGLPADREDGVVEAFARRGDRIRLVLVHHEEAAALMAAGYAKATGRVGVCLATSGPGALRLLGGLYDAKLDHQPVLAVTESQEIRLLGTSFRQELALESAFDDVADYNVRVNVPVQIPAVVDIGIGHALARGTVSHITFPPGLEDTAVETSPWMLMTPTGSTPTAPLFTAGPGVPPDADLRRAAEVLNRGARVAVLVGAGGLEAREELLAVADTLAGPVVKSLPGKAAVPDDHPFTTGCIGVLGTRPSEEALAAADTLLLVGTSFPWAANVPDPAKVRAVQIETDPARFGGAGAATEVTLLGDAAETLGALLPLLGRKADRGFLERAQAGMAAWRRRLDELEDQTRDPIQPQYLMRVVDRYATPDAILASDSGTVATWSARHFDVRGDRHYLLSANLATIAAGLPYAIAAQWAHPGRCCIAVTGSDGFAKVMGELLTAVQYDLPVKIVVSNVSSLGRRLRTGADGAAGDDGAPGGPADFASWAAANGALGLRVEHAADVEPAVRRAFTTPGPALVDVLVNPEEHPRPAMAGGA
jgi:pyruvate dehydrogenase (quinone)